MTGLDDHRDPDGEKIEEGVEGGEDGRTHALMQLRAGVARGANRAAYLAERPAEGGDGSMRVVLVAGPMRMTARAHGSTPGRRCRRMLPSSDESHDPGSAFFRAGG
jgi:hypothetical protein